MSSRRGERGFTITELLVALTVTVIGLAGLLSLHVTTVRGNASASRALEAVSIAEESLEILRSKPLGDIEAQYGAATTTEEYYYWDGDDGDDAPPTNFGPAVITGRAGQQYRRVFRIAAPDATQPNLIRITAEVLWNENAPAPLGTDAADTATIAEHRLRIETVRTRIEAL
jgi:prepilin-type N-terminal cleavage/methylation domain-containing protein